MKKTILILVGLAFTSSVFAQKYSGGLPLPGLPKSLGQKTMANSTSVTMAFDQSPITVTGAITAVNPSVGNNFTIAPTSSTEIGGINASGNLQPFIIGPQGITVSANQGTSPWVVSGGVAVTNTPTVNQGTNPWNVTAAITNTPTVNQGTNPWNVTAAITNTPTVNQGTSPWVISGGVAITNTPTVTASRNWVLQGSTDSVGITGTVTANPVTVTASTVSRIANAVTNATLLAVNGNRKAVFLFNDSTTTNCYVKFGATASLTSFTVKMFATDTYIMDPPTYTGIIDYICDAASGNMEVNEQ